MDEKMREIEERLIRALKYPEQMQIEQECRYLLTRIKRLVEGIEKHKEKYKIVEMFDEKIVKRYIPKEDEELYKLIEKEKP